MPYIAQYLLKLSISLAVVHLFYVLVLRRLTFYNLNRWYLLGYSLLSFIIPFVNISPFLEKGAWTESTVVQLIPIMGNAAPVASGINGWGVSLFLLLAGISILLVRLLIQYVSFLRIRRSAMLISDDAVKIYQVDQYIIPFSFGRSIFINQHQHKEEELKEIIRHEFIHVKQRHTVDILFGEILSMLNWYNPFTWFIRHAIRQNLEFIADHQVLKTGLDRKEYQYMLLKVVGTPAFAIANQFNLSSLKKRIAMMNKIRSARVHMIKFLFVLPLITVLLLAFRQAAVKKQSDEQLAVTAVAVEKVQLTEVAIAPVDTTPVSVILKKVADTVPAIREVRIIGYGKKDTTTAIVIDASKDGPANPNMIRFRGVSTGMPPLLIVDGVRQEDTDGGLKNLNPDLIESISVLKDASAESIYGEQGKYGVLLVTTKKGIKITPTAPAVRDTVKLRATIRINGVEGRSTGLDQFTGLYIVDGVPSDSVAIRNINPEDIESIQVIKGQAAEAVYGSKGAQGVILITKKKKDKRITLTIAPKSGPGYYVIPDEEFKQLRGQALRDHVLYVGVANQLPIDIKGVKADELIVTLSTGSVNYQDGIATIKPTSPGKAELKIYQRKVDGSALLLQSQVYDVKLLPPPSTFTAYNSYNLSPVNKEGKP